MLFRSFKNLFKDDLDVYALSKPPKPVGYWRIGADPMGMYGSYFPVYRKPSEKEIKNHYNLLGWEYVEKYIE